MRTEVEWAQVLARDYGVSRPLADRIIEQMRQERALAYRGSGGPDGGGPFGMVIAVREDELRSVVKALSAAQALVAGLMDVATRMGLTRRTENGLFAMLERERVRVNGMLEEP